MSPGDRCDTVIRLIDEVLGDDAPEPVPADLVPEDAGDGADVEPVTWGVYYLKPSA